MARSAGQGDRRGWLARAGLAGVLLLNGGCVTTGPLDYIRNGFKVGPNYCQPPAPVAPEWIDSKDPNVQNRHLQDWWGVFQDPALDSLINTAYGQNLNLRIAGTRVLEARAQQAIAAGSIFPQTQQATGQYSRVGLSRNMANSPTALNGLLAAGIPADLLRRRPDIRSAERQAAAQSAQIGVAEADLRLV